MSENPLWLNAENLSTAENSRETGFCIFVSSQTQTQIAVYGQTDSTGHFLKHWEHVE